MTLLIINLAAAWFMCGLIWVIQLVHYPQFAYVGDDRWAGCHVEHTKRITWIVAPAMLIEAAAAVALVRWTPAGVPAWVVWAALALCAVNWLSTFFVQVPLHERLSHGSDAALVRRLVATNWVRTAAWTLRAVLLAVAAAVPALHA
jgi:hypothetical protein